MRPPVLLTAALCCAAAAILGVAFAQDEPPTAPRSGSWKGITGAKDPGDHLKVASGWTEIPLTITPHDRELPFRTPDDCVQRGTNAGPWVDVTSGTLPLMGMKGGPLKFSVSMTKIALDLDGDGSFETPSRGEIFAAKVKRPDGSEGVHHFRLRRDGDNHVFNRACFATGKIEGTAVTFIDDGNDGNYGDIATDAMRVGAAPMAQRMSDLVAIKGTLYHVKTNQAGSKAWYKFYEGPKTKVDLVSKYAAKAKPSFLTLTNGEAYVDATLKDQPFPAGTWTIHDCTVGPSMNQCVRVKAGRMNPIELKADEPFSLKWGMPGIIEFSPRREGQNITVSVGEVYGQGGEQYLDWRCEFYPQLVAIEEATKREVLRRVVHGTVTAKVMTDRPYLLRMTNDISFMGHFESTWQ